jgi:2,4-dienoyl-CoA reductase-like NADH-dependent reductase (Old Yellow Enzyme family)
VQSRLFSPVQVGPLTLATRTWIPAMVPWRATPDGEAGPDVIYWYARFAKGRPGAIVIEAMARPHAPAARFGPNHSAFHARPPPAGGVGPPGPYPPPVPEKTSAIFAQPRTRALKNAT